MAVSCRTCGKVCKTSGGLAQHMRSRSCTRPQSTRKLDGIGHVRDSGSLRGNRSRDPVPLPSRAGGTGRRRAADNLNPMPPAPGDLSYWDAQNVLVERAEQCRAFARALSSKSTEALEYNAGAPHVAGGPGEPEDRILPSSDEEDGDENRAADNARATEIRDAILRLARENSEKAGASIVDRFLRILTLDNIAEAGKLLKSEGLDTVSSITKEVDSEVRESMKERGFREVWVANPDNTQEGVCVYLRDPVAVIRRQLEMASVSTPGRRNFYFDPLRFQSRESGEPERTHPMTGDLANAVFEDVKSEVMRSSDPDVFWESGKSFMCMLQIYSDKSAMSLSTKAHVFYPLHIAVQNLESEVKDSIIRLGETVTAYLSTSSRWHDIPEGLEILHPRPLRCAEKDLAAPFLDTSNTSHEASQINKILFRCSMAAILRNVRDQALRGLPFEDADKTPRRAHLVLAAYSGDAPEIHLVTCTKQNTCPRCKIDTSRLDRPGATGDMRSTVETKALLQEVYDSQGTLKTARRDEMWARGFSTTEPALLGWPFMSIRGLDMYEIPRFDLLHCGPLGVLKHLLLAVYDRTRSKTLWTSLVVDRSGNCKTFSSISNRVLRACNNYLRDVDERSPAVGFSVDFQRGKKKAVLDGLFTDDGIASMLQGKDYRMVQEILPFIGVLIDRYCGKEYRAEDEIPENIRAFPILTKLFVLYQNMDQAMRRKDMEGVGFTDRAIEELEESIAKFQKYALKTLAPYQKSEFNFGKWHAYNHVVSDIRALGLPSGFDTSVFEAAHPVYKAASRATSRRHGTATADATAIISRNECMRAELNDKASTAVSARIVHELVNGAAKRGKKIPHTVKDAVYNDLAILPANGMTFNWLTLSKLVSGEYDGKQVRDLISTHKPERARAMQEFLDQLGDNDLGHKALEVIRQKAFGGNESCTESEDVTALTSLEKRDLLRSITVTILKSARIAGHPAPSLHHLQADGRVLLPGGGSGYRKLQRVISSASFSHNKRQFQDRVMIDGNPAEDSLDSPQRTGDSSGGDEEEPYEWEVWFAEALAFLRVRASAGPLSVGKGEEFVVVRYFEVLPRSELDCIDKATECIKLRWACDPCSGDDDDHEPWIDVVPATSMRGRLHVVDEPYPPEAGEEDKHWTERSFYVNKYKLSNYEATYHTADRSLGFRS